MVIVTRLPKCGVHMPKHIGKWLQEQMEHGWGVKVGWTYAVTRVYPNNKLFSDGRICPTWSHLPNISPFFRQVSL